MSTSQIRFAAVTLAWVVLVPATTHAQVAPVSPGALRTYSTIYSIGLEWDLTGDTDHDASATVEYRLAGTSVWRDALPPLRIDYNGANMIAGSLLFLTPASTYEVRLSSAIRMVGVTRAW